MCLLQCSSAPMLIAAMLIRVPALCLASSRRSATLANFPVGHGRVRGLIHGSNWRFEALSQTQTRIRFQGSVDPMGPLPKWLVKVFVFRPPTHFSHLPHPTFPISHILICFSRGRSTLWPPPRLAGCSRHRRSSTWRPTPSTSRGVAPTRGPRWHLPREASRVLSREVSREVSRQRVCSPPYGAIGSRAPHASRAGESGLARL